MGFVGLGALVALTAIGHAVALTVRYRRRELVTARALGCTAGQSRGAILFAAGVLAAFGLVIGLPIGLSIGRRLWEAAAARRGPRDGLGDPCLGCRCRTCDACGRRRGCAGAGDPIGSVSARGAAGVIR